MCVTMFFKFVGLPSTVCVALRSFLSELSATETTQVFNGMFWVFLFVVFKVVCVIFPTYKFWIESPWYIHRPIRYFFGSSCLLYSLIVCIMLTSCIQMMQNRVVVIVGLVERTRPSELYVLAVCGALFPFPRNYMYPDFQVQRVTISQIMQFNHTGIFNVDKGFTVYVNTHNTNKEVEKTMLIAKYRTLALSAANRTLERDCQPWCSEDPLHRFVSSSVMLQMHLQLIFTKYVTIYFILILIVFSVVTWILYHKHPQSEWFGRRYIHWRNFDLVAPMAFMSTWVMRYVSLYQFAHWYPHHFGNLDEPIAMGPRYISDDWWHSVISDPTVSTFSTLVVWWVCKYCNPPCLTDEWVDTSVRKLYR
jgi:hypothetical protein